VMHFAAKSIVPKSFEQRSEYYDANVLQTRTLLDAMVAAGVRNFVFSSSAAVFGDPGESPLLDESSPKKPLSPYGENKLEVERLLERYARDGQIASISLRYFNAAGADEKLRAGEWHEPETHLIPRVIRAALDQRPVEVFGSDYPTEDGTCI